jgi:hypothetical protein
MIDLLDGFTPEFRFEVSYDGKTMAEKKKLYRYYSTTTSQYGFPLLG